MFAEIKYPYHAMSLPCSVPTQILHIRSISRIGHCHFTVNLYFELDQQFSVRAVCYFTLSRNLH